MNDTLSKFYLEGRTKRDNLYSITTLSEVRDGIMKYLCHLSDEWKQQITTPAALQPSNNLLDNLQESSSREATSSKSKAPMKIPMTQNDLGLLMGSHCLDTDNPLGLFRKVWFDLTLHLGCGGQSALRGLSKDSFLCEADDKGRRFYRLNHSIKVQRARSCMEMQYWHWEGRMYEMTGDPLCPVKSMDKYFIKRNPAKEAFFQRPKSHVQSHDTVWYESPVGHGVLACLMSKMAEDSGLSRTYTNSSIRVTLADLLEKHGYCVEEIMGINPRNKSVKSLQTRPASTSDQLRKNSKIIHNIVYNGTDN